MNEGYKRFFVDSHKQRTSQGYARRGSRIEITETERKQRLREVIRRDPVGGLRGSGHGLHHACGLVGYLLRVQC